MQFALDLSLSAIRPVASLAPMSDPAVISIDAEGWRAVYDQPAEFDPVTDPRLVVVDRQGHDAAGRPATVTDLLTITSRVREPWPDDQSWTPDDVALSDVVYQGDSVRGVANNSTRAYPKPQALWLNHDRQIAESTTFTARLAVAHAHARKSRPVAAVLFRASDGTTTVETLVTEMAVASYATGLSVPHFAGDMDFSALAPGALVTVDAEIRPWVGPAFTLSSDADPYPSVNLTVLKVLNDFDAGYGRVYAYVDPILGDDASGVSHPDAVTARAAPYATLGAAVPGINAANGTHHGRSNLSGGVIRLEPGVTTHQGFGWHDVGEVPLVIEAADPLRRAETVYRDAGSSVSNGLPDMVLLRDLTLRRNASGNVVFLDSSAQAGGENLLVTERCTWDDAGLGAGWNAWVYRVGRFWMIDCDGVDLGQAKQFSSDYKAVIAIGSGAGSLQSYTYHAVACRDLDAFLFDNTVTGNVAAPGGDFFGWNHMGQGTDAEHCLNVVRGVDDRGLALVGNVIEQYGGTTGPVYSISADGVTEPCANINIMANTAVGSRTNLLYQDTGSTAIAKWGRCGFNVDWLWNSKDDAFLPQNGARTGNWGFQYRAGFRGNAAIGGSNKGAAFGPGDLWLGEVAGLDDVAGSPGAPIAADWRDDRSTQGAGTGGGDYRPGPGHALPRIAAGWAPYPVDQRGMAIDAGGTAVAGALQP